MSRLAEFRNLELKLAAQLAELETLKNDGGLKREIEFEQKLLELLGEYGYSLSDIVAVLDPLPHRRRVPAAAETKGARKVRAGKVYRSPPSSEVVDMEDGNYKVLKESKAEYDSENFESETIRLWQLPSSTGDVVNFQKIDELFSNAGIGNVFASNYRYLAEVISNVYEHARSDTDAIVNWDMTVSMSGDFIDICISDDGQGVLGSISKRDLQKFTDTSAMEFALSLESRIRHRGKGLKAIIRAVSDGSLKSMSIWSGNCLFIATEAGQQYDEAAPRQGTEVRLTISLNGGRA